MQITKNDAIISLNLTETFNRYTLSYTATTPLRCTLRLCSVRHLQAMGLSPASFTTVHSLRPSS